MDLLTIRHEDFTMYAECTKFEGIWNKAEGVGSVERNGETIARGETQNEINI